RAAGRSPAAFFFQDQAKMILRASASGSFAIRHWSSQIIVLLVSGSVASHFRPATLGFPVAANAAHDDAIFFASACASGVLPVPCSQRLVLSKQNWSSAVCHAPGTPSSIGVCHVK